MTDNRSPEEFFYQRNALIETFEQPSSAGACSSWQPLLPITSSLTPVQSVEIEMMPSSLHYVFDIAERQQSPVDFAAVTALACLATIVGNRVRIAPKQKDDWLVTPNVWGVLIGRPSAMKSPAMHAALEPLHKIQDSLHQEWESNKRAARLDSTLTSLDAKSAIKRAEKAIQNGDREGARSILQSTDVEERTDQKCPRLIVNDASVEKLGELPNENPRGLLLVRDELTGLLAKMENEDYASDRAFYLEAYNGNGRFTYDRIGRGTVHINNCTLSLIGGIQPSRIIPIVRGAMKGATNDGFIQRIQLMVWPDDNGEWRYVDRQPNMPLREAYSTLLKELHATSLGTPENPHIMRFSDAAQSIYRDWITELHQIVRRGEVSSVLESHLLKMPKMVASLALIFEIADGGRTTVGSEATAKAIKWASYFQSHARRLYSAGDMLAEDGAKLILERRSRLPHRFTVRDIHQKAWTTLTDVRAVTEAVQILEARHYCRELNPPPVTQVGRPTKMYIWNPAIEAKSQH